MVSLAYDSADLTYDSVLSTFDGGSTQAKPSDLRVDLWLSGVGYGKYSNETDNVLTESGVSLARGRTSETGPAVPSRARLSFKNNDGKYSPRNTGGIFYGKIGRNTPLRVGFGAPVLGVVTIGTTALTCAAVAETVNPTPYATTGVMAVGYAVPQGNFTLPAGYSSKTETDATDCTIVRGFNTDNAVVTAAAWTYSTTPTATAMAHVVVPGGTLSGSTAQVGSDGQDAAVATSALPGTLLTAVCVWSQDPNNRMQPPQYSGSQASMVEMYLVADSGAAPTGPRMMIWAWTDPGEAGDVRLQGANDSQTEAGIELARWTGAARYTPRFTGEIADWPIAWDKTGKYVVSSVEAGGALRRFGASTQDVVSPLRGALLNAADVIAYWPLEDPPGSMSWAAGIGANPMTRVNLYSAGVNDDVAGSLPLPDFTGGGARGVVDGGSATSWLAGCVVAFPTNGTAAGNNLLTVNCGGAGAISTFSVEYTSTSTITLKVQFSDGTATLAPTSIMPNFPDGLNGSQMLIVLAMHQSGADIVPEVYTYNITPGYSIDARDLSAVVGTIVGKTLSAVQSVMVGVEAGGVTTLGTNGISMGHVFACSSNTFRSLDSRVSAARGYDGTVLSTAARYLATDVGLKMTLVSRGSWDTLTAGASSPGQVVTNLQNLEVAGQALMSDAAGYVGVDWRPYASLISSASVYTFNYTGSTFTGSLSPVDNDAVTLNDATVQGRTATARSVVLTGTLGAQPGGLGRYAATLSVPAYGAAGAADLASWLTHVGTLDEQRWPELTLEMGAAGNLALDLPVFSIGDVITVSNLPSFTGPTPAALQVVGFAEEVDAARYTITVYTRPADAWRVFIWDDPVYGLWADSASPSNTDAVWGM